MRTFLSFSVLLALTVPVWGETMIDDLHISRDGEVVNVRER